MRRATSNTLVYLIYGRGTHHDEAVYSMLSALDWIRQTPDDYRVVAYTDDPAALNPLPVQVEHIGPAILSDWHGPQRFNHRAKIAVARHALERFGGRMLLCDSDTWFVRHPGKAFARIGRGRSLLHVAEYRLGDRCARTLAESLAGHAFHDRSRARWVIGAPTVMFNSGAVGLHEADLAVLDEVLHLTDQIYAHVRLPTVEQLAFSVCLPRFTRVRQCYDVIHHYWPPDIRAEFNSSLARVLHEAPIPPRDEQYELLRPWAPKVPVQPLQWGRPRLARRLRARARHAIVRASELSGTRHSLRRVMTWLQQTSLFG